ncbi:MAG: hypothetical protein AAF602_10260 [Myxococcota bacterium]
MAEPENPFDAMGDKQNEAVADHRVLLAQTQPWLLLVGVLCALAAVFLALGGFMVGGMGGLGLLAGSQSNELAGVGAAAGVIFVLAFLFYSTGALIYGAFSYFLIKQGMAIARFRGSGSLDDLAVILKANRDFWRLLGLMTLVGLALYCVLIGLFMSMGAAMQEIFQAGGFP